MPPLKARAECGNPACSDPCGGPAARPVPTATRIRKFKLDAFADAYISSCFVHLRKPDTDLFRLALDIVQAPAGKVIYIENTPMFVQVAKGLGIRSILHTSYRSTRAKLSALGLKIIA